MSGISAQELYDLEHEGWEGESWDLEDYESELSLEMSERLTLVDDGGKIQAFVFYRVSMDEAWIMHLAAREKNKGWGTRILRELLEKLAARKITRIGLEVRATNAAARKLYDKFAFHEIGQRARYYPNGEDAIVLLKEGHVDVATVSGD